VIYQVERWDPEQRKMVKVQKWEKAPLNEKGHSTLESAQKLLTDQLNKVHRHTYRELQEIGFAEFAQKWLDQYAKLYVKRTTYQAYECHVRVHFIPAFGSQLIHTIDTNAVQAYLASKLAGGAKPKSVKNHLRLLKEMFSHAIEWRHAETNPAAKVKAPKADETKTTAVTVDRLTPGEVRHLLTGISKEDGKPFIKAGWYVPIKLAIFSGLRQGEQFALRVGDLDFRNGQVRVERTLTWYQKRSTPDEIRWAFTTPKTKNAVRRVDLPPDLLEDLKRYVAGLPDQEPERLLFQSNAGTPLDPKNVVDRVFKKALSRAELRSIRWHDLRHTYASLQLAAGAKLKYLSLQMGHASIDITVDRYGHLLEDTNPEQAARLARLVFDTKSAKNLLTEGGKNTVENGETPDKTEHEESAVIACQG
jgi:integrase